MHCSDFALVEFVKMTVCLIFLAAHHPHHSAVSVTISSLLRRIWMSERFMSPVTGTGHMLKNSSEDETR